MNQSATTDKGADLLAFLKATATLRRRRISTYGDGDRVIWFSDMPTGHVECRSPFLMESAEDLGELWLEIRKKRMPMRPPVPETIADWVRADDLEQTETEPGLYPEITVLVEVEQDSFDFGDPPEMQPELRRLDDHPEVEEAWLEYLVDQWEPWAKEMRRWQELQNVYEDLDFMRRRLEEAEERYELLLAVGLLQWCDPNDTPVKRHLLTAPAEIVLDAARGLLSVVPATSFERFRIELDMLDLQHQPSLDGDAIESRLDEFDIEAWNTARLAPVLREIANRLRSDAQIDEERFMPVDRAEERPRVSYAPALVLRERRPTGYDDLIRQFLESAGDGRLEATRPWSLLLREGDPPEDIAGEPGLDRDHDAPGRESPERFLFPLPANDEQREIVHRLHHNPCVLVKGPPGTGKSHTIANLICHLLAMGDHILVTAQAPKALAVLGGLLPADVSDLSVTALGSSRGDQRHLEESVRGILRRKNEWRGPAHDQDAIDRTEKRLLVLEGELAKAERFLRESREAETHPHALPGGYQGTAAQIARRLDEQREQHGWLPDRDDPDGPFPLDGAETAFLAEMHARLDEETLAELRLEVGAAQLPEPDRFKTLVATTAAAEESATRAAGTAVPEKVEALGQSSSESLDALRSTLVDLENLAAKATRVLGTLTETILADLLAGSVNRWNRLALETEALLRDATALLRQLGTTRVELPSGVSPERLRTDAQQRLAHFRQGGRRGFGILAPRVVKETAYIEKSCLADGRKPDSVERLASVVAYLGLDRNIHELARLWPDVLPALPSWRQTVAPARDLTNELRALLEFFDSKQAASIAASLPGERTSLSLPDERNQWIGAITAELAKRVAQGARAELEEVLEAIRECRNGASHPCLTALAEAVKARDLDGYRSASDVREHIREQKERLARYDALLDKMDRSCPGLAELLRSTAGDSEWTGRVRAMKQAWAWSSAHAWLRQVSDAGVFEERVRELHRLQRSIEKTTGELVSIRAWGAFFDRLDQPTVHSLNAWTKAVGRIGKGTGKYAYRHRRTARRYLMDCVPRIPAWVMPLHRLWDMVDAEPGLFDTAIVDEASQASVDALALLLLAKRIIVVGDDKQNSPEAVGVPEDSIARLAREHLKRFRFRDEFRPDTSLFDHAERSFEHPITLREHFRCVPEIIRFSNDLCYRDAPLIPLRQAPPNRLPAMESRFVAEGACEGKGARIVNRAEAEAVVDEIKKVIDDEDYQGKSIGVIALQGSAQAHLIEHELAKRLDPETMEERRLRCGGPAAFQGDERDIVFLSLVVAPNVRHRALTTLPDQRRFNVAMSRARDQVRLFHSVRQHDLGPDDLRRKLIAFFETPAQGAFHRQSEDLERLEREARSRRLRENQPEPYESWFEVDVALELLRRRFAVHPQAVVAGYRIDLVVEGIHARLAVECDGDAWHGAEQYERDMARQRQLERAGWTFVRIRESAWYADREAAVRTVLDACDALRIHPLDVLKDTSSPPVKVADMNFSTEATLAEPALREEPTLPDGVDPKLVAAAAEYVRTAVIYQVLRGVRKAGDIARVMIEEYGADRFKRLLRRHFRIAYEATRQEFAEEPWIGEMTPGHDIEAALAATEDTIAILETAPASEASGHDGAKRVKDPENSEWDPDEMEPFVKPLDAEHKRTETREPPDTEVGEGPRPPATMLYETEALDWNDVRDFFQRYGCVVAGNPELRWYQESWGALLKSNLACVTRFEECSHARTILKLRAICLLAMYLGIYQETGGFSALGDDLSNHDPVSLVGDFSGQDPISCYLDSLKVEREDLWGMAHREGMLVIHMTSYGEDEEEDDYDLAVIAMTLVEGESHSIYKVLRDHYGGDSGLFASIWNSRVPPDRVEPMNDAVSSRYEGDGRLEDWEYVRAGARDMSRLGLWDDVDATRAAIGIESDVRFALDSEDTADTASAWDTATQIGLRWNTRYEASKPRLIQRLKDLMRYSDESELGRAEQTIAAIRSLPNVGEYGGSIRIENRVARQPGDSDFIYSLFVSDEGFELTYHERLMMEGGQRDYTDTMTLVRCRPVGWETEEDSADEEALANMREFVEMMAGRPFSDEEWQMQVEAAREMEDTDLPNGIDRWLEMLPVDDEGKCPGTVSVEW